MEEKRLNQLNKYLESMDLPFQYPLVEALIRNALVSHGEKADDIASRLYKLADSVPPGEEASLLFEQLIFDLFKEQKAGFDREKDKLVSPMRERLMTILDRWTLLDDFLHEEEQKAIRGRKEILREMSEVLGFAQGLLNRANHPSLENEAFLEELDYLTQQSEEGLVRIMKKIDDILNPSRIEDDSDSSHSILCLKVSLPGLPLPVWRRIRVSGQINLKQFHFILQKTMGWWDLYDHQFEQAGRIWDKGDEESSLLQTLLEEEDDLLHYYYDMGESWHHKIQVESVVDSAKKAFDSGEIILECLDGAGACPPEDCGGPEGFRMLVSSLKKDASRDLKEDFAWLADFDPQSFSLEDINKELKTLL